MPVFLLPAFVRDLQLHDDAHFAKRVLQKTLRANGEFRLDSKDHRYEGIADAWIRYVSRGRSAYRVIYLRFGEDVYLFRAGEHRLEDRLVAPDARSIDAALPVTEAAVNAVATIAAMSIQVPGSATIPPVNRFRRNVPQTQINREIFSRRNLPHKDIWLVSPFIDEELFLPTAAFGKLLLDQIEDGASVVIVTAAPRDRNIDWMERLEEHKIGIFVYPRLHTKLYCFLLDEDRRYECGLRHDDRYSSLILLGSANLTAAGMALGNGLCNEELCYRVPEEEIDHVEKYVTELMMDGYDLPDVRRFRARGLWQQLEKKRW